LSSGGEGRGPRRRPAHEEAVQGPRPPGALRLLNIGYGNLVLADRIVAIVSSASAPMRRLREEAGNAGRLVDATQGRRTRSILVTDSHHVILSAVNPETIATRLLHGESIEES
jgi:hypothetical protein